MNIISYNVKAHARYLKKKDKDKEYLSKVFGTRKVIGITQVFRIFSKRQC